GVRRAEPRALSLQAGARMIRCCAMQPLAADQPQRALPAPWGASRFGLGAVGLRSVDEVGRPPRGARLGADCSSERANADGFAASDPGRAPLTSWLSSAARPPS